MSDWHDACFEDINFNEDNKTMDVYVTHNDSGSVYVRIPINFIIPKLLEYFLKTKIGV